MVWKSCLLTRSDYVLVLVNSSLFVKNHKRRQKEKSHCKREFISSFLNERAWKVKPFPCLEVDYT